MRDIIKRKLSTKVGGVGGHGLLGLGRLGPGWDATCARGGTVIWWDAWAVHMHVAVANCCASMPVPGCCCPAEARRVHGAALQVSQGAGAVQVSAGWQERGWEQRAAAGSRLEWQRCYYTAAPACCAAFSSSLPRLAG